MRTTFDWRRGLFFAGLIGGGMGIAMLLAIEATPADQLSKEPFSLIIVGSAASWGLISFVLGAIKPAESKITVTRPTVLRRIVEITRKTLIGIVVGGIGAMIVELVGIRVLMARIDLMIPDSALKSWPLRLGFGTCLAAATGSLIGGLTGAWTCRDRVLATSIRASLIGIYFGGVSGAAVSILCGWETVVSLILPLGSGVVSGMVGATFARASLSPAPTNPVPVDLSTAIEVCPTRDMP